MTTDNSSQGDPADGQRRYYDRYLAEEMGSSATGSGGPGRRKGPIIAVAAVAVLAIGGGAFALTRGGSSNEVASSSTTTATSVSGSSTPQSDTSTNSTSIDDTSSVSTDSSSSSASSAVHVAPKVAGWQSVVGGVADSIAYDVPPSWHVEDPKSTFGFKADYSDQNSVIGDSAATQGHGYCSEKPETTRASVSVIDAGDRDVAEAGPAIVVDAADILTRNKGGDGSAAMTQVKTRTFKVGSTTVLDASTVATLGKGKANVGCNPGSVELHTVTLRAGGHTSSVFIARDVVSSGGTSAADIKKIVDSVRPVGSS